MSTRTLISVWLVGGDFKSAEIGDSRKDVQTRSTVGLGHCDAHQAELAHLFDRRGWEPVFLVNFGLAEKKLIGRQPPVSGLCNEMQLRDRVTELTHCYRHEDVVCELACRVPQHLRPKQRPAQEDREPHILPRCHT